MSQLLGGRYDLQEQIGGGGMAVVYRAVDTLLGRQVAVKMLRSQYVGDEEFVRRFRREAQSAASLSHPNIVNLYDVGVNQNSEYYLVMEYVDGPTLKDVIRDRGPLSVKETLELTRQICDALEHAHEHNIIHRDIKPHNILLTKTGNVKVTDFGIARATSGNTITHHHSGSVLGSVHYFSPEQARGAAADVKSDIYSLGVVMYEMLTGKLPFSGDSPVSVALKHLRESFVEPREINPTIPQSVENIVLRCLVKAPEARYQDMKSVKDDLKDALIHPDVPKFQVPQEAPDETIAIPVVGGGKASTAASTGAESHGKAGGKPRRKWTGVVLWSGVALAVLLIGVFAAYYIVMDLLQVPNLKVPNVVGKTESEAVQMLKSAGFDQSQIQEQRVNNAKPKDTVYDQNPEGPTEVKKNRSITLWISNGPQQQTMPDLAGVPVDEAKQQLINMGISADNIQDQLVPNSQYDTGYVVGTKPDKGATLTPDMQVVLQVSQGAVATVPDVIGMPLDQAVKALQDAGLTKGQVTYQAGPGADGTVIATAPYEKGSQVPKGTAIGLFVTRNNGESGGGLPPANQTGGGNGGGASGLPPGTTVKTVQVKVTDGKGKNIHVQIYKTDAQYSQKKLMVDETISATKLWSITVYVTPDTQGEIMVYEDSQLKYDYQVPYQSQ